MAATNLFPEKPTLEGTVTQISSQHNDAVSSGDAAQIFPLRLKKSN